MEREFRDELADSGGRAVFWIRLLIDFAISLPSQFGREVMQDVKHALRLWARRPLHVVFAIAALAIGIGANVGVFSVVDVLLLRSLPFRDPSRLVTLLVFSTPHDSADQFHDWRKHSTYLDDATIVYQGDVNLGGVSEALRVHRAETSWNFFSMLGTQPVLGRAFSPEEDTPGRSDVAVIGYGLWQQLFGGEPTAALGSRILVDGISFTVIGIAPPGFDFPAKAAIWTPTAFAPNRDPRNKTWETLATLKAGITWAQARDAFATEAERLIVVPGIRTREQAKISTESLIMDEVNDDEKAIQPEAEGADRVGGDPWRKDVEPIGVGVPSAPDPDREMEEAGDRATARTVHGRPTQAAPRR